MSEEDLFKNRRNYHEEIERLEEAGYDKTRFCSAECALIYICDHCFFYDFKPGDCGCYLDAGQCEIYGRRNPEDGNRCQDYVCRSLRKAPQWRIASFKRIMDKKEELKAGKNICLDCWGNLFCPSAEIEEDLNWNFDND